MVKYCFTFFCLLSVLLFSCSKTQQDDIPGFDRKNWIASLEACDDVRYLQGQAIIRHQEKLHGLSQNQILKLLGTPTEHELYRRRQKYFYYFISTPAGCNTNETKEYLQMRFDAFGNLDDMNIIKR